jgi:DNA-binding NarL/FixJ family response regulator
LIETRNEFECCAETDDAPTARQLFLSQQPKIVLLGLTLRGGDGIQLIKDLRSLDGDAQIVVFSARSDALSIQRALRAGAHAYLLLTDDTAEILRALAEISIGHRYVSASALARLVETFAIGKADAGASNLNKLSDRELEVFSLMGKGFGSSRLARELRVSPKTIETHEERMKIKLACTSVSQLRERAVQWVLKCGRENLERGS